jgi:hypothetical protein
MSQRLRELDQKNECPLSHDKKSFGQEKQVIFAVITESQPMRKLKKSRMENQSRKKAQSNTFASYTTSSVTVL